MRKLPFFLSLVMALLFFRVLQAAEPSIASDKLRVLLITGGHDFEKDHFFKLFKENPQITFQAVEHPNAQKMFSAQNATSYDVIVMYDFNQKITDEDKANFVGRLKDGKGLVVLHHAIATYP